MKEDIRFDVWTKKGWCQGVGVPLPWLIELFQTIKGHPGKLSIDTFADDIVKIAEARGIKKDWFADPERIMHKFILTFKNDNGVGTWDQEIDATDEAHAREEAAYSFKDDELMYVTAGEQHPLEPAWHEWPIEDKEPADDEVDLTPLAQAIGVRGDTP